jgi:putative heme-binding domain-containing protein
MLSRVNAALRQKAPATSPGRLGCFLAACDDICSAWVTDMSMRPRVICSAIAACGFAAVLTDASGASNQGSAIATFVARANQAGQADAGTVGDASRGKALVESSGCFDCHRVADRGSRLGPNLTDIGERRTTERLLQALVAPDEEVLSENRFVRVITKDGATVSGKLLNQDAISVQLLNPKEELKTYLRATLREYTILEKGLMPSVQGKLAPQQIADMVAYLSSLKGS